MKEKEVDFYLAIAGGFQWACIATVGAFFTEVTQPDPRFEMTYLSALGMTISGVATLVFYAKAKHLIKAKEK